MRRAGLILTAAAALFVATAAARDNAWQWDLPEGTAPPPVPADNPMNRAKVDLGRKLFYDADLSINGTMACSNCHDQDRAFADGNRTRPGVHGDPGRRNVPGLANIGYLTPLTWADPRLATLEDQVGVPVFGETPVEMGMKGQEAELIRRLAGNDCYQTLFRDAFPETGGAIDMLGVTRALAAFQRSMISFDSPADRHRRGQTDALLAPALRGERLFAADCATCHSGQDFTDGRFHALEGGGTSGDRGLIEVSGLAGDEARFRTPSLRNVALTAPYLHDGSAATLQEAIARHGRTAPVSADLIAYLEAMTDSSFVENPAFAYPDDLCRG